MSRTDELRKIKDEILTGSHLPLYAERMTNGVFPVIGEGSHEAKIMFVGEAPGRNEAATGKPFCGASGRVLDKILAAIGIPRNKVYVTNIVKDRPPMNRDPLPQEIEAYAPYLDRQIAILRPAVIATLGRFSMTYIMTKFGFGDRLESISRLHGREFSVQADYGPITILPLYHPAVAVYNNGMLDELKKDAQSLKKYHKKVTSEEPALSHIEG